MLKVLAKNTVVALLLALLSSQIVCAESKLYQYDGNMPFVKMMLSMMVAMGMLDRLPSNMGYGGRNNYGNNYGNRYGQLNSPWSRYSNPYARALAMRGINPGYLNSGYGNNPFSRSPWLQSPWSQSAFNNTNPGSISPVWGSPSWGVMPYDNYSYDDYSVYGRRGRQPYWSSVDLDGWVNEPWEKSAWNPKAETTELPVQQPQNNPPVVQNFYNVPGNVSGNAAPKSAGGMPGSAADSRGGYSQQERRQGNYNVNNNSPLARLARPGGPAARQPPQQANRPPATRSGKQSPLRKQLKPYYREKPCITEFCGLKKPNLNGLWVAENGEMLGINNHRYLWSDPSERYLSGEMQIQNEYLLANVDGHDQLLRFKYKFAGNHLLTLRPDGTVREFVRMPINQYGNSTGGY